MRFNSFLALLALCLAMTPTTARTQSCKTVRTPTVCPNPAKNPNQPCSDLPNDVNFAQLFGYAELTGVCQQPFDDFSWQEFIALNWPLNDLSQPRPWEQYTDPDEIFNGAQLTKMRQTVAAKAKLTAEQSKKIKILYKMAKRHALPGEKFDQFLQSTMLPLIDRNLNFAIFEEKVNPVWVTYVTQTSCVNGNSSACLNTLAGQWAFMRTGGKVKFPTGFYQDDVKGTGGSVGAMELKAAWRILDLKKGDDPTRYYTRFADIYMDGEHTVTKKPLLVPHVLVGLVGLHINTYTKDGRGTVWSTFEQEDNAPQGPPLLGRTYSFYNAGCKTCTPNTAPPLNGDSTYLWETTPPFARRYRVDGQFGTQVTIVNQFYKPTEDTNTRWHKLMPNTVWVHYRLIGSQWENHEAPTLAGIPVILANSVQETYVPQSSSTCIGCHNSATLRAQPTVKADLSFLLSHAH